MHSLDASRVGRDKETSAPVVEASVSCDPLQASPHCQSATREGDVNKEHQVTQVDTVNCDQVTASTSDHRQPSSVQVNQVNSRENSTKLSGRKLNLKLIIPNHSDIAVYSSVLTDETRSASVPCMLNEDRIATDVNLYLTDLTSIKHSEQTMGVTRNAGEYENLLSGYRTGQLDDKLRSQESPLLPPVRRAMSLSSSYPDPAQICRMRRLYCPRQPPTMLRRTLSISRTNLSKKKKKKLTNYQKNLLLCLSMVSFTSFLCMSIMAPFFPLEASAKGMSGTISGLVFSCYALVVMLASPLLGAVLPKVGAKFMLISGIFAAGVTNILFGMLDQIESSQSFTIYCFLVRSCEALSAAAFSTASYTYIMYSFPDDIGTAFGLTETCVGLGMSLGPAIGSALYAVGGYGTPFYVLGTLILINLPICWYFVAPMDTLKAPSDDTGRKRVDFTTVTVKNGYWSLITIPEVAVVCFVVVSVSQSQGFLDPTLEPHFRQYNISTEFVGLAFLLMSASYAILSPFIGKIAGKFNNRYPLMIAGLLISFIGLLLLGPSPFIPFTPNPWISSLSMILMGFGYAVAFIPTFECILLLAIKKGFEDNVKTYSLVSGLWSSMYSLGEVIGPTIGGLFVDTFDFRIGSTIIALISLFTALLTTITSLIKCHPSCSSDTSVGSFADSSDDDDSYENTPSTFNQYNISSSRQSNLFHPVHTCTSLIGTVGTFDSGIGDGNVLGTEATGGQSTNCHHQQQFTENAPMLKRSQGGSVGYLSPSYGTSASAFRQFGNSV